MNSAFPGMQWGNFGSPQVQPQNHPQRPAVIQPQVQAPEIDFADGLNNPIELALHPSVDLVGLEAAGPNMNPGTLANFRTLITRADRPGWQQEISGQAQMSQDGQGSSTRCTMGPPGQPVMQLQEQTQSNMLQGNTVHGQVAPGRMPGMNQQLQVTPGMNDSLSVQGHVDGWQIFEQSQQGRDPQGGFGFVKTHAGNIGGVAFQRVLRPAQDGSTTFNGQIGNVTETGRITTGQDGQTHVTRDIGPYHLEQDIWFSGGQPAQPMMGFPGQYGQFPGQFGGF